MSKGEVLSWEQAIQAMEEGKRLRNEYFTSDEWFEFRNGRLFAEDGCPMCGWFTGEDWQLTGWTIIEGDI